MKTELWVNALGWALLQVLWQACVLGVVCGMALYLLRQARPQARYFCLGLTLLLALLLPVCSVLQAVFQVESVVPAPAYLQVLVSNFSNPDSWNQLQNSAHDYLPTLVLVWGAGVLMLALRMVLGLSWLQRYVSLSSALPDSALHASVQRLSRAFGWSQTVMVRVVHDLSGTITGPVALGILRPLVLIPGALLTALSPAQLEAILAHEFAHIRRHDYLINLLQNLIAILLFFHPVVWWLMARIRVEREHIADDLAVQVTGEPRRLALALQELERFQFLQSQLALAAHGGSLMMRIQRLLRPKTTMVQGKTALTTLALASMMVALAAQAVPQSGMLTPVPAKADTTSVNNNAATPEQTKPASTPTPAPAVVTTAASATSEAVINFNRPGCKPTYPRSAIRNEATGTAHFDIAISARGNITQINLKKSSGHTILDQAVIEKLQAGSCKATPARHDGKAVASMVKVQYVWRLS